RWRAASTGRSRGTAGGYRSLSAWEPQRRLTTEPQRTQRKTKTQFYLSFSVSSVALWLILLLHFSVHVAERDVVLSGDSGAFLVFWLARLHPHHPPRRGGRAFLPRLLRPLVAAAADAEGARLAEQDRLQLRGLGFFGQHAHQDAGALLLHLNGRRP